MGTGQMNHYQALMLDPDVDMDLMSTVYRRLVQRYQTAAPADGPARERLRAVEQAYEVLRDPFRRARYDAELERAQDEPVMAQMVSRAAAPPTAPPAAYPVPVVSAVPVARTSAAPVAVPVVSQRTPTREPVPVNVLDFGRYAGWSLRQIAVRDPDYLQWLLRSPGGRQYRTEITAILQPR